MKEPQQERTLAGESAPRATQYGAERVVLLGAEVADDRALVPGPTALDRIELWRIGRQPAHVEPGTLLHVAARFDASMGIDAVPQHQNRRRQVAMKELQKADYVG